MTLRIPSAVALALVLSGTGVVAQQDTIRIASANAGKLVNAANGNAKVDYTVDYDSRQNAQLNSELVQNYGNTQAYGTVKDLKVSVTGNANRVAGAYADTITVTIAAN